MTTAAARAAEAYTKHTCQLRAGLAIINTAATVGRVPCMPGHTDGSAGVRLRGGVHVLGGGELELGLELGLGHTYPGVHGQAHLEELPPGLRGFDFVVVVW